jgi:plasmid stabilization system protein ParE
VTYRVVFTARARADAVRQFQFLADRSPAAAARWYTGLEKAIVKLGRMPERHPVA